MLSSRLPGKVMQDIAGRPMIQHVVERASRANSIDKVVVATTTDPSDDILERFCLDKGISYYRGSLTDVLDRFYQAALKYQAEQVVRLTGDCPLLDPALVDRTVAACAGDNSMINPSQFATNRLPPPWKRTLPIGLDVEVCSFAALQQAWEHADQPYQREHVMPYLYEGIVFPPIDKSKDEEWYVQQAASPHGFMVILLNHRPDYGALRWTVDTSSDLEFVRQVFARLADVPFFGWQEVLALTQREPSLALINATVKHKTAFDIDPRTEALSD